MTLDRAKALDRAFEFVHKSDVTGLYCEFGVYQGLSLVRAMNSERKWRERSEHRAVTGFLAFDSFTGLPELRPEDRLDGYDVFRQGQFSDTSVDEVRRRLRKAGHDPDEVEFLEGWFEETLPTARVRDRLAAEGVAIVHLDCDLASSALACLTALTPHLRDGCVILYDDWFCYRARPDRGVRSAHHTWTTRTGHECTEYFRYGWSGIAFFHHRPDAREPA